MLGDGMAIGERFDLPDPAQPVRFLLAGLPADGWEALQAVDLGTAAARAVFPRALVSGAAELLRGYLD
jgi:hypothetical protein